MKARKPIAQMPSSNGAAPAPATVEQLLGTADPQQQAARIQQLGLPVVTFIIQFDQRDGKVTISTVGADLPFAAGHKMLDLGRQALVQLEARAQAQQQQVSAPAAAAG